MKPLLLLLLSFSGIASSTALVGQQIVGRGLHHRDIQWESRDGRGSAGYTELSIGLHYWDGAEYRETQEILEPAPGGAEARFGQHKAWLNANLNSAPAVRLTMVDGQVLESCVLALAYTDRASSESVLIGQLQDSEGAVVPPNEAIYIGALGLGTAVRYTYAKDRFIQDVLIFANPGSPADYGLNPETCQLEIWTEFLSSPQPDIREHRLYGDSVDQTISFGPMVIRRGSAFVFGNMNGRVPGGSCNTTGILAFTRQTITSIAANGDPAYSSPTSIASAPFTNCVNPAYYNFEVDGTNRLILFNPDLAHAGKHLGAVSYQNSGEWLWQMMPSGPMDGRGTFDTNCNLAGAQAIVVSNNIFCVYTGEGWYKALNGQTGRQANQIFHYKTDGTFVGQFGMPAWDDVMRHAIGSGSNMRTLSSVIVNGVLFVYTNDERGRGTHRWRIEL